MRRVAPTISAKTQTYSLSVSTTASAVRSLLGIDASNATRPFLLKQRLRPTDKEVLVMLGR